LSSETTNGIKRTGRALNGHPETLYKINCIDYVVFFNQFYLLMWFVLVSIAQMEILRGIGSVGAGY